MRFENFRTDLKDFPFDISSGGGIWYILIDLKENCIIYYTCSKTNKNLLLNKLIEDNKNNIVIGFWKGEWRCDGFIITKESLQENKRFFQHGYKEIVK